MSSASHEDAEDGPRDTAGVSGTAYGPADVRDTPHVGSTFTTEDPLPEERDPWIGKTLSGVYEIVAKIGEGGMGAVYHAKHKHLKKSFAIKVLADAIAGKDSAVERLKQEAMAAANIDHENIVDVVNFDSTDHGAVYIVMELLKGEALADAIARGPLELHRALPITYQICRALHAAHEHGIVHRDLKPENVFLSQRGGRTLVKVLDFGISKVKRAESEQVRMTRTGQLVGTPLYMSPEQARGESEIDRRVDVYAMGVMLYEMIAGAPPFEGRNYFELLWKHGNEPPPPMKELNPNVYIPAGVDEVVRRALAKDPDKRHQTMAELELALMAAAPEVDPLPDLPSLPPDRRDSGSPVSRAAAGRASTLLSSERSSDDDRRPVSAAPTLPARKPWPFLAVGLGAALVLGAVVYAVSAPEDAAPTDLASDPPVPVADPPAIPDEPPEVAPTPPGVDPPPPATVSVSLQSQPPGVEVRLGDRLLGSTPLVAPLDVSEEAVELVFAKPGYLSRTLSVVPRPGLEVPEVRLLRRRQPQPGSGGVDLPIKTGM